MGVERAGFLTSSMLHLLRGKLLVMLPHERLDACADIRQKAPRFVYLNQSASRSCAQTGRLKVIEK